MWRQRRGVQRRWDPFPSAKSRRLNGPAAGGWCLSSDLPGVRVDVRGCRRPLQPRASPLGPPDGQKKLQVAVQKRNASSPALSEEPQELILPVASSGEPPLREDRPPPPVTQSCSCSRQRLASPRDSRTRLLTSSDSSRTLSAKPTSCSYVACALTSGGQDDWSFGGRHESLDGCEETNVVIKYDINLGGRGQTRPMSDVAVFLFFGAIGSEPGGGWLPDPSPSGLSDGEDLLA
ncbi:hypothetical protein EYF80_018800 [Liparis tanakae]|uniref:Uncharacterized protein n=1 Tax=Liparis tanakae TaxID=230148 RepID=A0A4Z2I129_9TELE|nr:hypothetical protein EYF80_018800 [Liparis tanakae]